MTERRESIAHLEIIDNNAFLDLSHGCLLHLWDFNLRSPDSHYFDISLNHWVFVMDWQPVQSVPCLLYHPATVGIGFSPSQP